MNATSDEGWQPKLLLVDDEPKNLLALETLLEDLDVQLEKAQSGTEALKLCARDSFSLILMDVQMPEMDGVETLKQIRARKGSAWSTPVVAFTAHAQDSDVRKYIDDGFHGVLTKPIGPDALESFLLSFVG